MNLVNLAPSWLLSTGFIILAAGFILLLLRSGIIISFTLIILGVGVLIFWYSKYINHKKHLVDKYKDACICSICGHETANICVQKMCACCILLKKNKIIGHSNTSFQ